MFLEIQLLASLEFIFCDKLIPVRSPVLVSSVLTESTILVLFFNAVFTFALIITAIPAMGNRITTKDKEVGREEAKAGFHFHSSSHFCKGSNNA